MELLRAVQRWNVEAWHFELEAWAGTSSKLGVKIKWRLEIVVVFGSAGGAKHNYTATYRKESKRSSSPRPWNGPSLAPVGHRRTEANSATRPTYGQLVSRRKMNDETWVWRQPRDRNQDSLHFFRTRSIIANKDDWCFNWQIHSHQVVCSNIKLTAAQRMRVYTINSLFRFVVGGSSEVYS